MKNKMWRFLSLALVVLLLFATVVGCSKPSDEKEPGDVKEPSQNEGENTQEQEEQEEEEVTLDLGGRPIRLAAWWNLEPQEGVTEAGDRQIAYYKDLEEKYNFKIEYINIPQGEIVETFTASNLAGDPFAELVWLRDNYYMPQVASGGLYPLSDLDAFDFNEEKWDKTISDFAQWNGKQYGMYPGKVDLRGLIFWNKTLFEREGLPNLYELQENMEWNWDKFLEVAKKATKDTDGDGIVDQYGLTGSVWEWQLIVSNDADPIANIDGKLKYNLTDPKALEALQFYQDLNVVHKVFANPPEGASWDWHISFFASGKAAMMAYHQWAAGTLQGSMEDDYGVVAFPMGPRADDYRCELEEFTFLVMPSNVKNPQDVAFVYDKMTDPYPGQTEEEKYEAWRDGMLNGLRDEESLKTYEMLYDRNLLRVNRWFSFPEVRDLGWGLMADILSGGKSPSVAVEEVAQQAQTFIDETMGYNK